MIRKNFSVSAAVKFPEGTVAGAFKAAVNANPSIDIVRFDNQKFNWTVKELDKYSSAFAFGLMQQGYKPGHKLALWVDQASSAEQVVAQFGAIKAGVTLVTFEEKDNIEALE